MICFVRWIVSEDCLIGNVDVVFDNQLEFYGKACTQKIECESYLFGEVYIGSDG